MGGQCSRYQFLINGTSMALLVSPDLLLKGSGAQSRDMASLVQGVSRSYSSKNGVTSNGNTKSSSSSSSFGLLGSLIGFIMLIVFSSKWKAGKSGESSRT